MNKQLTEDIKSFGEDLSRYDTYYDSILPTHIEARQFRNTLIGAIKANPLIMNCNRQSIYAACQKAAEDGLFIDGREAAIVPYKSTATYIPMVKGLIKLMYESGHVKSIKAELVRERDGFYYNPSQPEPPDHTVDWFGNDRGEMVGGYAVLFTHDGGNVVTIMRRSEFDEAKSYSKSADKTGSAWNTHYDEMCIKTLYRRVAKKVPLSPRAHSVLEAMSRVYDGDPNKVDIPHDPAKPNKTRAAAIIEAEADEAQPDEVKSHIMDPATAEPTPNATEPHNKDKGKTENDQWVNDYEAYYDAKGGKIAR